MELRKQLTLLSPLMGIGEYFVIAKCEFDKIYFLDFFYKKS